MRHAFPVRLGLGLGLTLALAATAVAQQPDASGRIAVPAGRYTASEAAKLPQRVPVDPRTMVVDANGKVLYVAPPSCVGCETLPGGSAPGMAYVGLGSPASEPAPIGIMQANYANPVSPLMTPTLPPGLATAGQVGPHFPPAAIPPMNFSPTQRPSVVNRMLGLPRLGGWGDARLERKKSQHAAIRYDQVHANATSVPASLIYRR
jgi:hypothetical protein